MNTKVFNILEWLILFNVNIHDFDENVENNKLSIFFFTIRTFMGRLFSFWDINCS